MHGHAQHLGSRLGRAVGAVIALPSRVRRGRDGTARPEHHDDAADDRGLGDHRRHEPASAPKPPTPRTARPRAGPPELHVDGIHKDRKVRVGKPARAVGYLRPFVPGQHVRVKLVRGGHVVAQASTPR